MKGKWTVPGLWLPSAHLIALDARVTPARAAYLRLRCGRIVDLAGGLVIPVSMTTTDDVPATGKTCETCLRLSRRDS